MRKHMFLILVLCSSFVMLQASHDEAYDHKIIKNALNKKIEEIKSSSDPMLPDYKKDSKINSLSHLYINYRDPDATFDEKMEAKKALCKALGLVGTYIPVNSIGSSPLTGAVVNEGELFFDAESSSDDDSDRRPDMQDDLRAQQAQEEQKMRTVKSDAVIAALGAAQRGVSGFRSSPTASDNDFSDDEPDHGLTMRLNNNSIMTTRDYKEKKQASEKSLEDEWSERLQDYNTLTTKQQVILDRFGEPTVIDRKQTALDRVEDTVSKVGEKISNFFKGWK